MLLIKFILYLALALEFAATAGVVLAEVDANSNAKSAARDKQAGDVAEQALHAAVESAAKLKAALPESAIPKELQKDASRPVEALANSTVAVLSVHQELEALARNQQQLVLDTDKLLLLSQQTGDDAAADADVRKGLAAMKVCYDELSILLFVQSLYIFATKYRREYWLLR
jgi:hypothetical protein